MPVSNQTKHSHPSSDEILNHISECVITTNMDGVVTYWNRGSERMFGYKEEEILGHSLSTIYPGPIRDQFERDLEKLRAGEEINEQWRSITKDGKVLWIDVHAKPVFGKGDKPRAIIASVHDIQDLKKVETELEESKAQAQAILETTVDGIITTNEEGIILSFNEAASRIFGYDADEVIGNNVSMLMPAPHKHEHDDYMKRYRETGEKHIIGKRREMTGKRSDNALFPMELSVSEVKWNGNRIFTGVVNDISERRKLEREILRISEEERRSLGQDLHDGLGQMLTGIGLISQNLARKLKSNGIAGADEVQEISDLIKEADEYAKSLAHGLVQVNIEEEGLEAALCNLCRQAKKFFRVECIFNYDEDIEIDNSMRSLHLYRIAQEAISNAVKHGNAHSVEVKLKEKNGHIVLSITDDGIGFGESSQQKKEKGMGIHIMKYRANIMSGRLDILETEDDKTKVICKIPTKNFLGGTYG